MKQNKTFLKFIIIFLLFWSSCETEPNLETPDLETNTGDLTEEIKKEEEEITDEKNENLTEDEEEEEPTASELPVDGEEINNPSDDNKDEEYKISYQWDLPLPDFTCENKYFLRNETIYDSINDRVWNYNVLLPPSYFEEDYKDSYPVLFLFHGLECNQDIWIKSFKLDQLISYCYQVYSIPEFIVIMPEADDTYYLDSHLNNIKYETFFFNIFMPYIKENYRISEERELKMTGGFSMGGYGAAYYALKYNQEFGFCYAMSAPLDGKGKTTTVASLFPYFNSLSLEEMPYFTMDIGYGDYFVSANKDVNKILQQKGAQYEFIYRKGVHIGSFWKEGSYLLLNRVSNHIYNNQTHEN